MSTRIYRCLLFICSGISRVGVPTRRSLMIPKVACMLIICGILGGLRKYLSIFLRIVNTWPAAKAYKATKAGNSVHMACPATGVTPQWSACITQTSTRGSTAIAPGATRAKSVPFITHNKKEIMPTEFVKITENKFIIRITT